MLAGAYGTVSDVEILWTLIAFAGLIFSIYNVREAFADVKALEREGVGNGRRLIARSFRTSEITRLIKQGVFMTIGVLAMTFPQQDAVELPLRLAIFQFIFTWGMITAAALTTYQSYIAFDVRRQIKGGAYDSTTLGEPNEETEKDES